MYELIAFPLLIACRQALVSVRQLTSPQLLTGRVRPQRFSFQDHVHRQLRLARSSFLVPFKADRHAMPQRTALPTYLARVEVECLLIKCVHE